jgi:L-threonylcarbamoyladenylate synthase
VIDDMMGRIEMIIDGGDADVGLESTVISLEKDKIKLLRPGYITLDDLLAITPNVEISSSVLEALSTDEKPESPGMKYKHYAPNAPITMVSGEDHDVISFFLQKQKEGCGILCFDEDLLFLDQQSEKVISLGSKDDVETQANRLFSALRFFDKTDVSQIYARETTADSLGLAVTNRLLRACGFQKIKL